MRCDACDSRIRGTHWETAAGRAFCNLDCLQEGLGIHPNATESEIDELAQRVFSTPKNVPDQPPSEASEKRGIAKRHARK